MRRLRNPTISISKAGGILKNSEKEETSEVIKKIKKGWD